LAQFWEAVADCAWRRGCEVALAEDWRVAFDFRRADRDQCFLLPPDMREWLPAEHLVWFVIDVVEELDVSSLAAAAQLGGAGRAPFDPRTLLAVLIYGYAYGAALEPPVGAAVSGRCGFSDPDRR